MKFLKIVLFTLFALIPQAHAGTYGSDHRQEVMANTQMQQLARATAMMVGSNYLQAIAGTKNFNLDFPILQDPDASLGVCSDVRFAQEPANPIACTGFLVAPDLLMTAGHCMVNTGEIKDQQNAWCQTFSWIFDYETDANNQTAIKNISGDRVFACKKVLYAANINTYDVPTKHVTFYRDIALIQLDRPAVGRTPFQLATSPAVGEAIASIGYPDGLPAKFVSGAIINDVSHPEYFRALLDSFEGQSGSPVFNAQNEVLGVLVRGYPEDDYVNDAHGSCNRINTCDANGQNCLLDKHDYPVGTEMQNVFPVLPYLH